jgi:hypothetical protein
MERLVECKPWSWGSNNELVKEIFYNTRLTTKDSIIPKEDISRAWFMQSDRADLFKEVAKCWEDKEKVREILDKANELDSLYIQYTLGKKQVEVDMKETGRQSSSYVILEPKKSDQNKRPIVIIPGISNDLDGLGSFPIKLALSTQRKVVLVAYPESNNGKVTKDFATGVEKSDNFGPHTFFFQSAINKIMGEETEIDICGVSAGSIIATELMKDGDFNKRVNQYNLLVPPGIRKARFIKGALREFKSLVLDGGYKRIPQIITTDLKSNWKTEIDYKAGQQTFNALKRKLMQEYPWWKNKLISGKGKKTTVIIAKEDGVTNGIDGIKRLEQNENLDIKTIKGEHGVMSMKAEEVIKMMAI